MNTPPAPATFRWDATAFVPSRTVPVADRGFRYGMMIFETIAVRDGRARFLDAHLDRLQEAAARTGLKLPPGASREIVRAFLHRAEGHGVARIHLTAGSGAFDAPIEQGELLVTFEPRGDTLPKAYRLADLGHLMMPVWPGTKTGNYWAHIRALGAARQGGFHEAVLIDPEGRIISAAMANLFAVSGGRLITPPAARNGVVREWVMGRRDVIEQHLTLADLQNAEEIFLTSSGIGVMPVSHFGERPLPSRAVSEKLRAEYES